MEAILFSVETCRGVFAVLFEIEPAKAEKQLMRVGVSLAAAEALTTCLVATGRSGVQLQAIVAKSSGR